MKKFEIPPCYKNKSALEFSKDMTYDKYEILYILIRHLFNNLSLAKNNEIPLSYVKKFNLKKITFPLTFVTLQKLIKQNKHLPINVNVLCDAEGVISNLGLISNNKCKKKKNILYLLMFKIDPSNKSLDTLFQKFNKNIKLTFFPQKHFFFKINNVQKLLNYRDYKLSNNKSKNFHRNFYCLQCFLRFRSENKKNEHFQTCNDNQKLIYPVKGSKLAFSNTTRSSKLPILGFCDFESVLQRNCERSHCKQCNKEECDCNVSRTQDINQHRPIGYSILFVDSENKVFFEEQYAGEDCVKHFFMSLKRYENIVEDQKRKFKEVCQIKATSAEWELYNKAKKCYICKEPFDKYSVQKRKVADHDHVSGKIHGAAHSLCNLQRKSPYYTPIFFHNAQG